MIKTADATDKASNTDSAAQEQDEFLEESLEETFPASDPIAPGRPSHEPSNDKHST